ncbi:uncharacterized protein J4E78_004367 [Alternaria triticimaculans]|uniref:uncharacterized protein n=1 Tax=Alternaria triticimaculans TaxID=297637 RepID=UPI0020C2EB07|nr:uncharacterized protein J4E78_004367 [Alternaria triticimaculans]KAI4661578.1 hypothetical protein J4E78_004367 [Alternaria triticimaculans]
MDQIYYVARRTIIYSGSLSPSCEAVLKAVHGKVEREDYRDAEGLDLLEVLHNTRTETPVDLVEWLDRWRGLEVANYRDMIDALVCLASDGKALLAMGPKPFTCSWQIAFGTAAACVLQKRGFRYLCTQYHDRDEDSSAEYYQMVISGNHNKTKEQEMRPPTWIPDWRLNDPHHRISIYESWVKAGYSNSPNSRKRKSEAQEPLIEPYSIDHLLNFNRDFTTLQFLSTKKDIIKATSDEIPDAFDCDPAAQKRSAEYKMGLGTGTPGTLGKSDSDTHKRCMQFFENWVMEIVKEWSGDDSDADYEEELPETDQTWLSTKRGLLSCMDAWLKQMDVAHGTTTPTGHTSWDPTYCNEAFFHFIKDYMDPDSKASVPEGRSFAVTVSGSIGFVPSSAKAGDVVLWGNAHTRMPVVLVRPVEGQFPREDESIAPTLAAMAGKRNGDGVTSFYHCTVVGECFFTQIERVDREDDAVGDEEARAELFVMH